MDGEQKGLVDGKADRRMRQPVILCVRLYLKMSRSISERMPDAVIALS